MYQFPQNQQQAYVTPVSPLRGIVSMGVAGALISATSTVARNIRDIQRGTKTRQEALNGVVKESVGTGLAVAAGAAVGKTLFRTSGAACLLTMLAVGIGAKYAYDGMVESACVAVEEGAAKNKTPKKA